MSADKLTRLSPSSLNLFRECPRCFWLQMNAGIHRPSGPFPSLPGGMDGVIKKYFDTWRKKGELPPEIRTAVEGRLFDDNDTLKKWRNWRTGLSFEDSEAGGTLSGALDDCVLDNQKYSPLDYKTRGWAPKENGHEFYQGQLDAYSLLLKENGYPESGIAYLVYYFPREVKDGGTVSFNVEVKKVKTSAQNALKEFRDALEVLRNPMPLKHAKCAFCSWGEAHGDF